jgi:hypothetical protein
MTIKEAKTILKRKGYKLLESKESNKVITNTETGEKYILVEYPEYSDTLNDAYEDEKGVMHSSDLFYAKAIPVGTKMVDIQFELTEDMDISDFFDGTTTFVSIQDDGDIYDGEIK